jgi:hypothetical protein
MPWRTADRTLQELHLLGLLVIDDQPWGQGKVRWLYSLAEDVQASTLDRLSQ